MKTKRKNIFKSLLALTLALIMVLGVAPISLAVPAPPHSGSAAKTRMCPLLVDDADILSNADEASLLNKLENISSKSKFDVAVVTVKNIDDRTMQDYTDDFYDYYGYGQNERNDGILLLVSMREREYHITTAGRCISIFTDARLKDIMCAIEPKLINADYIGAFNEFAVYCDKIANGSAVASTNNTNKTVTNTNNSKDKNTAAVISPESAVEIYMANKSVWMKSPEYSPMYGYGYCLLDLNFDGVLELISSVCDGSGRFSYNKFYRINLKNLSVEEFQSELGRDDGIDYYYNARDSKLLKNQTSGKKFYVFKNYGQVSSKEGILSYSESYMEKTKFQENFIFSEYWHPDYDNNMDDTIREYTFRGKKVSKTEYEQKTAAFYSENKDLNLVWTCISGADFDKSDDHTKKRLLLNAYLSFSYDGFSFGNTVTPNSSNSNADTSRHFPNGYKFEEDSYNFSNYGDTISKKYFTTLYGAEKGKLLYKKYNKVGGLCFGMAYTTAAIYNGYPSCSKISTLDKGLFKYKYCENIRDILNNKVQRLSDPTMDKTLISSKLPIGENVIGIEDYIKYAFVYQFSKTVSDTSVWCDNANVILDLAKQYTDENKIGLTIGITGKDKGMGGHRVLVVGYEGNDILVDDPNKTSGWNRITVNPDGSWTFGNADNNSYYIRYNVDYQRPFELLKSGKTETADKEFLDNTAAGETYVEDIDTLDKESKLLAVDSDSYDLDEKKFSAVYLESGDGQSVNAYWTDKTTASIKNINGGNRTVEFAGNGYIISAIVADSSDVDMTLNKNKFKTQVNSKKGSECTISVDACREDDSNNDISKKIEIVGTATDGEVTVERINKGIRVLGIENGTVNYYIDDNMVSTEKTDGNGDFFDIKYDAQGEDDTLQIKKVKFSKLRKFLKKIFKAIAKPFKALARYIKKLFSK